MSATLDSPNFSKFFNNAPILKCPFHVFRVHNFYLDYFKDQFDQVFSQNAFYLHFIWQFTFAVASFWTWWTQIRRKPIQFCRISIKPFWRAWKQGQWVKVRLTSNQKNLKGSILVPGVQFLCFCQVKIKFIENKLSNFKRYQIKVWMKSTEWEPFWTTTLLV